MVAADGSQNDTQLSAFMPKIKRPRQQCPHATPASLSLASPPSSLPPPPHAHAHMHTHRHTQPHTRTQTAGLASTKQSQMFSGAEQIRPTPPTPSTPSKRGKGLTKRGGRGERRRDSSEGALPSAPLLSFPRFSSFSFSSPRAPEPRNRLSRPALPNPSVQRTAGGKGKPRREKKGRLSCLLLLHYLFVFK